MNIITLILILYISLNVSYSFIRKTTNKDYIETNLLFNKDKIYFPIEIGDPPQKFMLLFDTASYHLWIGNITLIKSLLRTFNPSISKTLELTNNLNIVTTKQTGNEVLDFIKINSVNPLTLLSSNKKFHFLLLNKLEIPTREEGVIGMSRNYIGMMKYNNIRKVNANPRFSLIHYLKINQVISRKVFSIKFIEKNKAKLYLGSTGYDKDDFPTCIVNDKANNTGFYNNWNCAYYGIALANGTYVYRVYDNEEKSVQFETSIDYIQISEKQARLVFNAIKEFTGVNCKTQLSSGKGMALFCPSTMDINKVPDFILKIKGFDFKIPSKEIFEYFYSNEPIESYGYISKIIGNRNNIKLFRIGMPFLKYYHLVFDYEKSSVGFVSYIDIFDSTIKEGIIPSPPILNKRRRRKFSILEIFAFVLLICIIIILAYYLYKRRLNKMKRMIHIKERLLNPIGKPMVAKNEG